MQIKHRYRLYFHGFQSNFMEVTQFFYQLGTCLNNECTL